MHIGDDARARLNAPMATQRLQLEPLTAAHADAMFDPLQDAAVTAGNTASARVLMKAGFTFTRRIPENDVIRGVAHDDDEYIRIAHPAQEAPSPCR